MIDDPSDIFFPLCGCRHTETVSRDVSVADRPLTYREERNAVCQCQTRERRIFRQLTHS
jgi:hypothetical protein